MRMRWCWLFLATMCVGPCMLNAQSNAQPNGWVLSAGAGVGVANVPTSTTPVYFDATQLTARLAVQHAIGAGFFGGVSLLATVATEGSDCVFGPCAPHFRHHAASASLSYVRGSTPRRWIPIGSLAAGVARLPEHWASTPGTRTPSASTFLLSGALDLPLIVRRRTALLVGWEGSVLPNAPGDRVTVNAITITMRRALLPRTTESPSSAWP